MREGPDKSIEWYRGYNKENISKIPSVNNQDITRNNGFKLKKFRFRREIGRNWFSNRVVDEWNRPIRAQTSGSFQRRLD